MTTQPNALDDIQKVDPVGLYFRKIWQRREFVWRVPLEEIRAENATTAFGVLWLLFNPLLLLLMYFALFSIGLRAGRGIEHFTTYLAIGIFFFRFSENAAQRGGRSVLTNANLMLTARFPRLILPISATIHSLFQLFWGVIALTIIALLDGVTLRLEMVLVPVILAGQILLTLGIGAALARAFFAYRDLERFVPHLFRLTFYASGVLFPVLDFFSEAWHPFFIYNPLFDYVSLHRWAILGEPLADNVVASAIVWTCALVPLSIGLFRQGELHYGRQEF